MTATLAALPQKVRANIRVDDEHWLWLGLMKNGSAQINSIHVKPLAWFHTTGENLHPSDRVIRDCTEYRCVNPDHQHIGTFAEAAAVGRERRRSA